MTTVSLAADSGVSARQRWGVLAAALFLVLCASLDCRQPAFWLWLDKDRIGLQRQFDPRLQRNRTREHCAQREPLVPPANRDVFRLDHGCRGQVLHRAPRLRLCRLHCWRRCSELSGAALVMNLLGWAIAAFCAWSLAVRLFGDPLAGLLAVAFVATGMGFVVHVTDYSAHLLAFTTYYLGVVILYQSERVEGSRSQPDGPSRDRSLYRAVLPDLQHGSRASIRIYRHCSSSQSAERYRPCIRHCVECAVRLGCRPQSWLRAEVRRLGLVQSVRQ